MTIRYSITAELLVEEPAWLNSPEWTDNAGAEPHLSLALTETARHMQANGTIAVMLGADDEMRRLNARWRNIDAPTDILAFPAGEASAMPDGQCFLGDLALGWGQFIADARKLARPAHLHMRHLATHGVLHLLGYDHECPVEARRMENLEQAILGAIGLTLPYG